MFVRYNEYGEIKELNNSELIGIENFDQDNNPSVITS